MRRESVDYMVGELLKQEIFLEQLENIRLINLAEVRAGDSTSSFEKFVEDEGFSMEELEKLSEKVEFE